MLSFHKSHQAEGTILVTQVEPLNHCCPALTEACTVAAMATASGACCSAVCLQLIRTCQSHASCASAAQVEDPSKYGVVVTDDSGQVERFVEKPKVRVQACKSSHEAAQVQRLSSMPEESIC